MKIKATVELVSRHSDGRCCIHCAFYDGRGICIRGSAVTCSDGYYVITKYKVRKPKEEDVDE